MRLIRLTDNHPDAIWGESHTPFGMAIIAYCDNDICWLSFGKLAQAASELKEFWRGKLTRSDSDTQLVADSIFTDNTHFGLLVEGSDFQINTWKNLMEVKKGERITYGELAFRAGHPKASRAIGTAIGKNNISFLIPCHRIVRANGDPGNYRWGADVKKAILEWEQR